MKIAFDTNVLFSAFISHGVCAGLYEECLLWGVCIVVSPKILEELQEKLLLKAKLSTPETREVLDAIERDALISKDVNLPERVCRDADDDIILGVALGAKADAIVTGDNDLLILKKFRDIPVLNPRDCFALLQRSG